MDKSIKIILLLLGISVLVAVYYFVDPSDSNVFFPRCPSVTFLGLYCPGCGSQRAVHQLLHADIAQAFRYNPLLVIVFPLLLYAVGIMLYNAIFDKKIRISLFYNNVFVFSFFLLVIVYFIARNLSFTSLECLVPPP
ncbi:MAG: DUF2752 domain-containing protein [Capnocytophaga sp.]|nr:DUF2752 domain-containing protein [Capnocytophaga sp.]